MGYGGRQHAALIHHPKGGDNRKSRAMQTLLRQPRVTEITGLPRSSLYALIKGNQFPRPVKLTGKRAVAWDSAQVEAWVAGRLAQRAS